MVKYCGNKVCGHCGNPIEEYEAYSGGYATYCNYCGSWGCDVCSPKCHYFFEGECYAEDESETADDKKETAELKIDN